MAISINYKTIKEKKTLCLRIICDIIYNSRCVPTVKIKIFIEEICSPERYNSRYLYPDGNNIITSYFHFDINNNYIVHYNKTISSLSLMWYWNLKVFYDDVILTPMKFGPNKYAKQYLNLLQ